ncbi:MAG: hypothetical protein WCF96_05570 [Eubacteriales bacterium]
MKLNVTQKKLAEQLVISVIRKEGIVTCDELASRINHQINWREVKRELLGISQVCKERGLPIICVKVVVQSTGVPPIWSFLEHMKELGFDTKGKSAMEIYKGELRKTREFTEWFKLTEYIKAN